MEVVIETWCDPIFRSTMTPTFDRLRILIVRLIVYQSISV